MTATIDPSAGVDGRTIAIGAADGIHLLRTAPPNPVRLVHAKLIGLTATKLTLFAAARRLDREAQNRTPPIVTGSATLSREPPSTL